MARPGPNIHRRQVSADGLETNVCLADAIWVVCDRGIPITIRRGPENNAYPGFKYLKSAWPHPGHAFNMADRLNEMFNTTDFTVWSMKPSREIREPKPEAPKEYNRSWTPTQYSADEIVPKPGTKPRAMR